MGPMFRNFLWKMQHILVCLNMWVPPECHPPSVLSEHTCFIIVLIFASQQKHCYCQITPRQNDVSPSEQKKQTTILFNPHTSILPDHLLLYLVFVYIFTNNFVATSHVFIKKAPGLHFTKKKCGQPGVFFLTTKFFPHKWNKSCSLQYLFGQGNLRGNQVSFSPLC